ncbi:DUF2179 domain-containing protein [Mycoplasma sp. 21DD0573]|uniref:DUF2179 domain-containing protein n=1 Tax=unclassified Mycoplasma TaxID=2683645 RepID=UPI002B1DB681|nr:DUF2179 domain-containing protein [Mycoplasma sp. 21DD0573]MEA4276312.1 DUF2179 domain-containing protein [Mycoplasma sp. 21DD0573]
MLFKKSNSHKDQNSSEWQDTVENLEKVHIKKENTLYKRTRMSNFGLKLNYFYQQMPLWKIILITNITAVIFGVIGVFFVKNVGIYNFGLAAFGQAGAKILVVSIAGQVDGTVLNLIDQFVFWVAYVILSIPIFIFGYKKVGKLFTNLTILFLVVSSLVSFGIGMIPGAGSTYIIGDFSNKAVKAALPEAYQSLSGLVPLLWDSYSSGSVLALMLYAIVYGVLLAYVFAIIQIIGGTAGVTGVIGEWYANAKQKSFGSISGYMNIAIMIVAVLVGSWLPGSILLSKVDPSLVVQNKSIMGLTDSQVTEFTRQAEALKAKVWHAELYFSPNFIATFLVNVVYIGVLDKLFPKFKLVRVQIFTKNAAKVKEIITSDKKIVTGMTIFRATGGYEGKDIDVITSVALFRHVLRIIKDVRKVDKDAFISISDIKSIDGSIYLPQDKF